MTSPKQQETEVKVYVHNLEIIRQRLEEQGARLAHERIFERNVRYDSSDRSLTERGIVLRLREDNAVRLTYKSAGSADRGIITREELEVELADFDTMEAILGKLGYQPYMVYEKHRTTYALGNTEIMLDELPYGDFIEVEGPLEQIEAVLELLGLQDAERREHSYTKLFDFVRHHLELEFRDLTFENFQDIDVPESAFIPPGSIVIE
jgi:adenylate cyclase class 2